jgi:hypothetical protein
MSSQEKDTKPGVARRQEGVLPKTRPEGQCGFNSHLSDHQYVTDQVMPEKCPHCRRGALKQIDARYGWEFECTVCGRGWIVVDRKYWLACFDAAGSVYEIVASGEIIDRNRFQDDKFREELWNRVRRKS